MKRNMYLVVILTFLSMIAAACQAGNSEDPSNLVIEEGNNLSVENMPINAENISIDTDLDINQALLNALPGMWHAGPGTAGAGNLDLYTFHEDGTYVFQYNQHEIQDVIDESGTWSLDGHTLILTVTQRTIWEDETMQEIQVSPVETVQYDLDDTDIQYEVLKIDGVTYWKAYGKWMEDDFWHEGNRVETCEQVLAKLGSYTLEDGKVSYQTGRRIFPLLHFMMTKQSLPAHSEDRFVYMMDNPIFVTPNDEYSEAILFAPIHSKRTFVLFTYTDDYSNPIKQFYSDMPSSLYTYIDLEEAIDFTRDVWEEEFSTYAPLCEQELALPPRGTDTEWLDPITGTLPFTLEMDFIAGVDGAGFTLIQNGTSYYPDQETIQLPLLLYCPNCHIDQIVMEHDGEKWSFGPDEFRDEWQDTLGEGWFSFESERIDLDYSWIEEDRLYEPSLIQPTQIVVTIDGEDVVFVNH